MVARDWRNGDTTVRYSKPAASQQLLAKETIFPSEYARQVLAAAQAGRHVLMHTVFDGSSLENPVQISTSIGNPIAPGSAGLTTLAQHTAWPVHLAYFPAGTAQPLPSFQMNVVLYDNGVAGDMVYDYGGFEIGVTLEKVTLLPIASCQ